MCYKDEVQKKNADKLQKKFEEYGIPMFIRLYLFNRKSKLGSLNYLSVLRNFLQWLIDSNIVNKDSIQNITPDDMVYIEAAYINMYLEEQQSNGISPTTLYTRKNIIRSFWAYMTNSPNIPVKYNVVKDVAYEGIDSKCNSKYIKMPTKEELEEMRINIINKKKKDIFVRDRNLTILTILKETGLRECELVELELDSLFLNGDEIEPSPFIRIMGKGVYYIEKGRNVLLSKTAKAALLEWLEIRKMMNNVIDDKAIFLNKTGRRMKESDIRAMFKVYSNGKLTPHMIRHWYGTIISEKFGVVFSQQQMGHKNASVTVNTYVDGGHGIREKLAQI